VSADDAGAASRAALYDVIDARAPGAARLLAQRLGELASVRAAGPATDSIRGRAASAARRCCASRAAPRARRCPVLLTGETGNGQEVAARLLHEWSPRPRAQLHPDQLRRDPERADRGELFGYAKGAFTGRCARTTAADAAEGGTVFLDEVDDTPLPFQVKLLRVLEDRVVSRIGENASHVVDFRILAATNRDLRPLCAAGCSAPICTSGWRSFRSGCRRCASASPTCPRWSRHFARRFYRRSRRRRRHKVEGATPRAGRAVRVSVAGQHPRAAQRDLRGAGAQARGDELLLSDLPRRVLRPRRRAAAGAAAARPTAP
jgi:hypothetical protein